MAPFKTIRARVLCLVLCLLSLTLTACKTPGSTEPLSPGLSLIKGEPIHDKGVALRSDTYTVTDGMLAYYFYSYGLEVMQSMEAKKAFDSSKNLHDQMYTDTESWYDTIMNTVLARVSEVLIYCEAANRAGEASLDDEMRTAIEEQLTELRYMAAAQYSEALGDYLVRCYGPLVSEQDVTRIMELEQIAARHSERLNDSIEASITGEQAQSYAKAHNLWDETPSRGLVLIAAKGNSREERAANAEAAKRALATSPKAETALALTDYGTPVQEKALIPQNVGIKAVGDWLFAEGRRVGDIDTVTAGDAVYVLFYNEDGISRGEVRARMALFDEKYATWYNELVEGLHFGYNYDVIDSYDVSK